MSVAPASAADFSRLAAVLESNPAAANRVLQVQAQQQQQLQLPQQLPQPNFVSGGPRSVATYGAYWPKRTSSSSSSSKGSAFLAALVILVIVGLLVWFFLLRSKSSTPSSPSSPPSNGPSGPSGPDGPDGPNGPIGPDGPTSAPGCSVTSWGPWSTCSAVCGGFQFSTRSIAGSNQGPAVPPDLSACPPLVRVQGCDGDGPSGSCGPVSRIKVDCIGGTPSATQWSGCPTCVPASAGSLVFNEWQFVPPAQAPQNGGLECDITQLLVTRPCNGGNPLPLCPPDTDCALTEDPVFTSACNVPCGGGVQLQLRGVETPPSGRGAGCDWRLYATESPCNTASCDPNPLDQCAATSGPWMPADGNGGACDVVCGSCSVLWVRSTTDPACPTTSLSVNANAGFPCGPGPLAPSSSSPSSPPITLPCRAPTRDELLERCYLTCLGASSQPTTGLGLATVLEDGTALCSVSEAALTSVCGVLDGYCPAPQDCSLTDWTAWSACSLDQCDPTVPTGGLQRKTRSIAVPPSGGGAPCVGPFVQTQPCNTLVTVSGFPPTCAPVDCELSAAAVPVGPCSAECGGGWQFAVRSVSVPPSGGGAACPTEPSAYVSSMTCNESPCAPCAYMSSATFFGSYLPAHPELYGPCSSNFQGRQLIGPVPIVSPAQNGGTCDATDAFFEVECCTDGCYCPVGCDNQECSGAGTCNTVTFACECNPGRGGVACADACPVGANGLACSGRGSCGTGATCECADPFFGPTCEYGGACVLGLANYGVFRMHFAGEYEPTQYVAQQFARYVNTASGGLAPTQPLCVDLGSPAAVEAQFGLNECLWSSNAFVGMTGASDQLSAADALMFNVQADSALYTYGQGNLWSSLSSLSCGDLGFGGGGGGGDELFSIQQGPAAGPSSGGLGYVFTSQAAAEAGCAVFGARLASLSDLDAGFERGAQVCTNGWIASSDGSPTMAMVMQESAATGGAVPGCAARGATSWTVPAGTAGSAWCVGSKANLTSLTTLSSSGLGANWFFKAAKGATPNVWSENPFSLASVLDTIVGPCGTASTLSGAWAALDTRLARGLGGGPSVTGLEFHLWDAESNAPTALASATLLDPSLAFTGRPNTQLFPKNGAEAWWQYALASCDAP